MSLIRNLKIVYLFLFSLMMVLVLLTFITVKAVADPYPGISTPNITSVTPQTPSVSEYKENQEYFSSPTQSPESILSVTGPNQWDFTIQLTGTPTSTYTPTFNLSLPVINVVHDIPAITPSPVETKLFCDSIEQPIFIPDNNPDGVSNFIDITENQLLVNLSLYIDVSHSAVGDLMVKLTNPSSSITELVLNRPGNESNRCAENDIVAILKDQAAQKVDDQCASESPAISGIYLPSQNLSSFTKTIPSGTWRINISDHETGNVGELNHWCIIAELSNVLPSPTPTPDPVEIPSSAYISGMTGQGQYFNLDCESRSAVDWAKHFGNFIDELEFYYHLPQSNDDPEAGFVGAPNGPWGFIPPDDYGVHAKPIADLLRDYGLTASAYKSLTWDDIRTEIAQGNPVIVWIIGDYSLNLVNGIPHLYIPSSTNNPTIVAPYEHTVIVVGYSPDSVTILNGSHFLEIPLDQFLDSWSVLDFMAVLARP
jgi:subtilisin-like proprotein convertase family protein/uncharacterized protein YvpB